MSNNVDIKNRRYIGNKAKLVDWILPLINERCKGGIFADIFAGTGAIAAAATKSFDHIILNDLLYSNYVIYEAFWGEGKYQKEKLEATIKNYNNVNAEKLRSNFFSKNFGGKYFDKNVAKLIGFIRNDIEKNKKNLSQKEYFILISSLIYAIDKIANTVGHYDAYIKKRPEINKLTIDLIRPQKIKEVEIFREDANSLVKRLRADVVYIDPPYNSRQYSRFYHLLETLVKWDKPELYGVALKPKPENTSDYCRKKAPEVFEDLINNLKCKYIAVSYNNTYSSKSNSSKNKIELGEIKKLLNTKGRTKVFRKKYRFFNTGKTNFFNHQEFLFITKVNE